MFPVVMDNTEFLCYTDCDILRQVPVSNEFPADCIVEAGTCFLFCTACSRAKIMVLVEIKEYFCYNICCLFKQD